ncbi:MAG TPA: RNA polymerase sigma factor [Thermoanaerobaculia bacterium]|nr:RNA polymerase sigma factor [Thermoanaerobaculia bacterium]
MVVHPQHSVPPVEPISDEEVVERVLGGETALYEILMRRYNRRLFRIARSVLRDPAEAEDVMQDAYVRAFEKLEQFEGTARFSTWLTRIALYEALARKRKARRVVGLPDPDSEPDAVAGGAAWTSFGDPPARHSQEEGAFHAELRAALEAALDALPESLRLAFLTRHVEGMSTAEAAECLGVSESALKVRLHRARERLRGDLERRMGEVTKELYAFGGERCDRVVARVLGRIGAGVGPTATSRRDRRP